MNLDGFTLLSGGVFLAVIVIAIAMHRGAAFRIQRKHIHFGLIGSFVGLAGLSASLPTEFAPKFVFLGMAIFGICLLLAVERFLAAPFK